MKLGQQMRTKDGEAMTDKGRRNKRGSEAGWGPRPRVWSLNPRSTEKKGT